MSIERVVKRLIEMGIDLGTRDAVKSTLETLNADTDYVDDIYITLKNHLNAKAFAAVPVSERLLFLPHCLRKTPGCPAEMTEEGYVCQRCGACAIDRIMEEANKLGYRTFIVPGGSMVYAICKKYRPKAAFGVACYSDLEEAISKLTSMGIPTRAVPLTVAGCVNTKVDVERIIKELRIGI